MHAYMNICKHVRICPIYTYMSAYMQICEHVRIYAGIYAHPRCPPVLPFNNSTDPPPDSLGLPYLPDIFIATSTITQARF